MSAPAVHAEPSQRDWWLRAALVLQAPRAVFTALRDDSPEAAAARQEPVLAIVILAGIGSVLMSAQAGRLMDDPALDATLVPVWAFIAGGVYGVFTYWLAGGVLHLGLRALGSRARFRRSRHLLAFAATPLALSLVAWLPRLALYGEDSFRSGGSDTGAGAAFFHWLQLGFALWAFGLLLVGIRSLERWTWPRSLAALAVAAIVPALLVLASAGVI
jgi:hypothetical protein